jgi:hypothetical protein
MRVETTQEGQSLLVTRISCREGHSQETSLSKRNCQKGARTIQGLFTCAKCEYADRNAAFNIAYRVSTYSLDHSDLILMCLFINFFAF